MAEKVVSSAPFSRLTYWNIDCEPIQDRTLSMLALQPRRSQQEGHRRPCHDATCGSSAHGMADCLVVRLLF